MSLRRLALKQWLLERFIIISEIIGYAVTAAVGIGVIYSLFVRVEVIARVEGELHPARTEVVADADVLPINSMVSTGQEVKRGEPILRVARDETVQRRVLTRRRLEAALTLLETKPDRDTGVALGETRRAIAALPPPDTGEILTSPAEGILKQLVDPNLEATVSAGKPLAVVYDLSQLQFDGRLGASTADQKVAAGQTARVAIPGVPVPIVGHVESVNAGDTSKTVTIRFDDPSPEVRELFQARILGQGEPDAMSVHVDIVVGSQSLFKEVFGRKR